MTPCSLVLDPPERTELLRLLTQALHDKSIEVHRTDTLTYKESLEQEERVLRGLLDKVKALSA